MKITGRYRTNNPASVSVFLIYSDSEKHQKAKEALHFFLVL
ncbi:FIG00554288: hypothetical protein [Cronobacter universalis NCTC 9529]|nr:FIG00554288: hypothetical protein [Cronobacter universalis NCTC 9529]